MIVAFRRPCVDHRATLIDFVDRRELGPATAAALDHLDRCRSCEAELAGIAMAITALRRLHRDVESVEPPADAWLHLRSRLQRRGDPWRWRTTLAGLSLSTLIVGVIVAPITFGIRDSHLPQPPWLTAEIRREAQYLATIHTGDLSAGVPPEVTSSGPIIPPTFPDEMREIRKEVAAAKSAGRPPVPI